jgi:nicotinamidase-related amidase
MKKDYQMNEPIKLDKNSTALVVIDLQKGIVGMPTQPYDTGTVVCNAAKLANAFRKNNMPVFLVRVQASPDKKDRLEPVADTPMRMTVPMPADWSEIVPELGPEPNDFVVTKKQWGAFYGTDLDLQLRRRKIETIVLCGIATNIGVESTARFAYEFGYQQIFAEDAMSGRSKEEHDHAVMMTFPRIGRVRKTNEILAGME